MSTIISTIVIGVGATLVMDLWGILRKQFFGIPAANYGLVGRWLGYMPNGRFVHDSIGKMPAIPGETLIGWTAHYLIGIAFAALLVSIGGTEWLQHPTPVLALVVGMGTVAAPFLLMQPGMGAGIAASRMPNPAKARVHSLITHGVFGAGLYIASFALTLL